MRKRSFKTLTSLAAALIMTALFSTTAFAALPEGVPGAIEPPMVEKIEPKNDESGKPYFLLEVKIPQSVLELDKTRPTDGAVFLDYYVSIDKGAFEKWDGGYLDVITENEDASVAGKSGSYQVSVYPVIDESVSAIDISKHTYDLKLQLFYQYYYGEGAGEWDYIYSAFSNQVAIGAVPPQKPADQPQTAPKPEQQTPSVTPAVAPSLAQSSVVPVDKTETKLDDVPKTGDDSLLYLVFPAANLLLGATVIFAKRALKKA
ncbi:hypothetical protein [Desulfosporosinus lacus]|uniref:LPXTG-motif cell wall anchor domain-containing protein n=1 Tax=Desulfosporosinus lacus DSM 15449 TaxID=1121420 RepID=A0A1M6FMV4_9FIRM|nr:hypothetical protein [Desulfosporosinus lacus]SHI98973.1 hypothetical protein SAMN02746098_04966 [Desulfosporosinus lacus DSM 15449]